MTGRYHLCDHIHHIYLVLADHGENGRPGCYLFGIPKITYIWFWANMGNMVGPAGTICAITYITYIWYRPIMGNMVGPAGTSCAITFIMYIWYRPIMGNMVRP